MKSEHTKAQETGMDLLQGLKPQIQGKSHPLEHPAVFPLSNCSAEEDSRNSSPSPVSKLLEDFSFDCSITDYLPENTLINGKGEDQSYSLFNGKEDVQEPCTPQRSPLKQKPPAVSKKPKISFVLPFNPQTIDEQVPSQTEDQVDGVQRHTKEEEEEIRSEREEEKEEETSESSEPLAESKETSTVSQDDSQTSNFDNGVCTNGEEEEGEEGDETNSTSGSVSSKEDDSGECNSSFVSSQI